jgi:hypothetical protein
MELSKKLTRRHMTVVALAMGMSFPLYVMADTTPNTDNTAKVMTQTTTVVTHKHHSHMAMHKAMHKAHHKAMDRAEDHAEAMNNAKAIDKDAKSDAEASQSSSNQEMAKRVVWKNGVVYHEVEPTAQATTNGFALPASTSDTLIGGVTTTTSPAPQ